jgi:sulfur-oxidizing protein SoxY
MAGYPEGVKRRQVVVGAAAALALPAGAQPADTLAAAVAGFSGGTPVQHGRVKLEIAPLVDNGNVVPLTVTVDSPMTAADHVAAIAVFNEKNPQRDVASFVLGPRAGKAQVATRIRLATSQKLTAVARMADGSYWSDTVDVVVVLAACIEGDG